MRSNLKRKETKEDRGMHLSFPKSTIIYAVNHINKNHYSNNQEKQSNNVNNKTIVIYRSAKIDVYIFRFLKARSRTPYATSTKINIQTNKPKQKQTKHQQQQQNNKYTQKKIGKAPKEP